MQQTRYWTRNNADIHIAKNNSSTPRTRRTRILEYVNFRRQQPLTAVDNLNLALRTREDPPTPTAICSTFSSHVLHRQRGVKASFAFKFFTSMPVAADVITDCSTPLFRGKTKKNSPSPHTCECSIYMDVSRGRVFRRPRSCPRTSRLPRLDI